MDYPIPEYFDEFAQYFRTQGKAEGTIRGYILSLQTIPEDVEAYFPLYTIVFAFIYEISNR